MTNEMTASGLESLKRQLTEVRQQLKEVAIRIKEARDLGDLSENAEYLGAKEEQAFLMGRASDLEKKIKYAKVIEKKNDDVVTVGCQVTIDNGKGQMKFDIVGSDEADPLSGRISPESPIGAALYGRRKGESVEVATPAGMTQFKILDIA